MLKTFPGVVDETIEIASEIEMAMLAVLGLGEQLADAADPCKNIAGRLNVAVRDLRRIAGRLLDNEGAEEAVAS